MATGTITAERLRALLHYDPETGVFTWLLTTTNRVRVGDRAGRPHDGYVVIGIDGRIYGAHRLAWLYMTGRWPVAEIDHVDRGRADNRWVNLREATPSQNRWNGKRPKHNTSGYKGTSFDKRRGKWQAYINANGKRVSLGAHSTPEAAHNAYLNKADELHGEFARAE